MSKERILIYDFIRVISCISVIVIHCTSCLVQTESYKYNYMWWTGNIIQSFVRIGLPMFVLLSGNLMLNSKKQETIGTFYIKRIIKIVIPLFLYSFIYLFILKYNIEIFRPQNFLSALELIITGNVTVHLWFVYMILGLYLCTPFLKKMCQNLTDKECQILTILIFAISIIKYLLPSFQINIAINNITFMDWSLIYLLGYLVTRDAVSKHYKLIYILGAVSLIFTILINRTNIKINNLYDLSIMMLFESTATYFLFIRFQNKICKSKKLNKLITFLSTYTFEIYLIHVLVIYLLAKFIRLGSFNTLLWSLIMIILVPIISFIVAYFIHNIVIVNIEKLIKKYCSIQKGV